MVVELDVDVLDEVEVLEDVLVVCFAVVVLEVVMCSEVVEEELGCSESAPKATITIIISAISA